jgi:hypothetical protein
MKPLTGGLIIIAAVVTYMFSRNNEFDWNLVTDGVGKFRIIIGILYLLFGHLFGMIAGVLVGIWIIFKK